MTQPTLTTIAPELFKQFETGASANAPVVNEFFIQLAKRQELQKDPVDAGYYAALESVVKDDVLPVYEAYANRRDEIKKRQEQRSLGKYVLWTVGVLQGIELIASRGRSLRPLILGPSLIIEAIAGATFYGLAQIKDDSQLKSAKKRFFANISGLDRKLIVDTQYDAFKAQSGENESLSAEAVELFGQYDSPGDFWRDYFAVRKTDPTATTDRERLPTQKFDTFLNGHVTGKYNEQARLARFNSLFLLAHQAFLKRSEEHYVPDLLKNVVEGESK